MKKKKILIGLFVIVLIAAVGVGGTLCYFRWDTIKGWFGQETETTTRYDYAAELKTLQAQIESNNNEISTLQKEINDKQAIINDKQADTNAETAQEIKALEATITVLKSRIATLETENQQLNAQITELRNQSSGLQNQIDAIAEVARGTANFINDVTGAAYWEKAGNVVVVTLSDVVFSSTSGLAYGTHYVGGLPKASKEKYIVFTLVPYGSATSSVRLSVSTEYGVIFNYYTADAVIPGTHYFGQVVYCVD